VDSPKEIAAIWHARKDVNTSESSVIVTNPVAKQLDPVLHNTLLTNGLSLADEQKVIGKAVTPFLLEYFHRVSEGKSLDVNVDIIKANSKLAAEIAVAL
jgi:pseudouridine-5'-phosphate glycosidase